MHVRKNAAFLSGLRFIEGGDGSGGGTGEGAGTAPSSGSTGTENNDAGASGTGSAGGETPPAKQPDQSGAGKSGDGSGDTSRLKSALDKERESRKAADQLAKDRAAEREKDQQAHQKVLDDIAEALGVKKKDEAPDPAALARGIAERDARVSTLEGQVAERDVLLAAWAAAWEHGADPKRLMDSVTFRGELGQLDRQAADLPKQITDLVKTKVDGDESLKAPGQPRTPRPDPSQGSGRPAPGGGERGSAEAQRRFGNSTSKT